MNRSGDAKRIRKDRGITPYTLSNNSFLAAFTLSDLAAKPDDVGYPDPGARRCGIGQDLPISRFCAIPGRKVPKWPMPCANAGYLPAFKAKDGLRHPPRPSPAR